jgi:hypothetical protein
MWKKTCFITPAAVTSQTGPGSILNLSWLLMLQPIGQEKIVSRSYDYSTRWLANIQQYVMSVSTQEFEISMPNNRHYHILKV